MATRYAYQLRRREKIPWIIPSKKKKKPNEEEHNSHVCVKCDTVDVF